MAVDMKQHQNQNGLRRRTSRSPEPNGKPSPAATTTKTNGHVAPGKFKLSPLTKLSFSTKVVVGVVATACLFILFFFVYWWSLWLGLITPKHFNYRHDCPVQQWSYPWCGSQVHHKAQAGQLAKPLYSDEWLVLRNHYLQALAASNRNGRSSLAPDWAVANTTGFVVPIDIREFPNRGRGVVTLIPLKKGQKVWDNRYRGVFPTSHQDGDCAVRIFFSHLDNQLACDVMFWGYVNNFYGNGLQYMLDMDGHGYINHGDAGRDRNVVHHFQDELHTDRYAMSRFWPSALSPTQWKTRNEPGAYGLYATRDIAAGEEILYDYQEIFLYWPLGWYTFFVTHSLPLFEWLTL